MADVVERVAKRMAEEIDDRDFHDPGPDDWLKASRAAIAEVLDWMKEPSEAMLQGACEKHLPGQPMSEDDERECPRFATRRTIWRRVLEQARKEALG